MSTSTVANNIPQVKIDEDSTKIHDGGDLTASPVPFVSQLKRRQSIMSKNSSTNEPEQPKETRLNRRRSTFKGVAASIMGSLNLRRMTKTSSTMPAKPLIRMENTYKMAPDEGKEIKQSKIKQIVQLILESRLKDEKYSADRCSKLSCDLSSIIKSQIKDLNLPRYKYVCHTIIGECAGQGLQVASRCVWAPSTDNFEYICYSNNSLFAVATIYAIYYE